MHILNSLISRDIRFSVSIYNLLNNHTFEDNEESDFDDDDFSDGEQAEIIPKEKYAREVERADRVTNIFSL